MCILCVRVKKEKEKEKEKEKKAFVWTFLCLDLTLFRSQTRPVQLSKRSPGLDTDRHRPSPSTTLLWIMQANQREITLYEEVLLLLLYQRYLWTKENSKTKTRLKQLWRQKLNLSWFVLPIGTVIRTYSVTVEPGCLRTEQNCQSCSWVRLLPWFCPGGHWYYFLKRNKRHTFKPPFGMQQLAAECSSILSVAIFSLRAFLRK